MARKPKPKPQPEPAKSNFDEFAEESEVLDEDPVAVDPAEPPPNFKMRDWRDVERYKEMRNLRKLVDDDFDIDELLSDKPRRR